MENKNYTLPIGFTIRERYKIEKILGQGGFGITYLAHDIFLDKLVCIKELYISGSSTRGENNTVHSQSMGEFTFEDFKKRFIDEAKQLAKFNHPYIVKITDIFETNNTAYFVMEYAEGDTLKDLVKNKGGFNMQKALPIMNKILDAVEEVHRQGLLHRDIKPDNIIIKPNNNIVLIDFGSARSFGEGKTITQTAMLTPGFAPLEQYSTKAKRGAYSDIYALGATLYFMLTGEKPLAATERVTETLPAPHDLKKDITSQVSSAIMLAMELKSEDRFQSIKDFRAALEDVATIRETRKKEQEKKVEQPKPIDEENKNKTKSLSNFISNLIKIKVKWVRLYIFLFIAFWLIFSALSYDNRDIGYTMFFSLIAIYLVASLIINWKRTSLLILLGIVFLVVFVFFMEFIM